MKRISRRKWHKRVQLSRERKYAKRRRSYQRWRKQKNRLSQGTTAFGDRRADWLGRFARYAHVQAPNRLEIVESTEKVVHFINQIESNLASGTPVFVDLSGVKSIDYGAVIVLLSTMMEFKTRGIPFNGNFPKDTLACALLIYSGFFDSLERTFTKKEQYDIHSREPQGIFTHARMRVNSRLSADLIEAASITVWGEPRRCQGVQSAMLELMLNTNNHADLDSPGKKHWWVSVFHDTEKKVVRFAFVDLGVGVFKSLESKRMGIASRNLKDKWTGWLPKWVRLFGAEPDGNAQILEKMLTGELRKSVTGEDHRGRGLPGIAERAGRNQFSNLHIVTNNVRCSLEDNSFSTMKANFSGTLFVWELNKNNVSIQ